VSAKQRLWDELKALTEAFLYFTAWLGVLVLLKKLILDQYHIEFKGVSAALVGALVLSKVVLILEKVWRGRRRGSRWFSARPCTPSV
jgi:hypothetical protein